LDIKYHLVIDTGSGCAILKGLTPTKITGES
jgi:hypothetical protein